VISKIKLFFIFIIFPEKKTIGKYFFNFFQGLKFIFSIYNNMSYYTTPKLMKMEQEVREKRRERTKKNKKKVDITIDFYFVNNNARTQTKSVKGVIKQVGKIFKRYHQNGELEDEEGKYDILHCQRTIRSTAMYEQVKNINIDTRYFINPNEGEESANVFEKLRRKNLSLHSIYAVFYSSLIMLILTSMEDSNVDIAPIEIEIEYIVNQRDVDCKLLSHENIEYKINKNAKTFDEFITPIKHCNYIENNYKPYSCAYTLLIDVYSASFQKLQQKGRYKKIEISYKGIWQIIHPNEEYNDNIALGETLNNFKLFFEKFGISLHVQNIYGETVFEYIPEKPMKMLLPYSLFVLQHNNHLYHLNTKILSMAHKSKEDSMELTVSRHYNILQFVNNNYFINHIDEIIDIDYDKIVDKRINIIYNDDMELLLHKLIFINKFEPIVKSKNNIITSISFYIGDKYISLITPPHNLDDRTIEFDDKKAYNLYQKYDEMLYKSLVNKNNISKYSTRFIESLKKLSRNAFVGRLINTKETTFTEIDINKAYTSLLLEIKKFPVFLQFDEFQPYDNHKVEDYTIYNIETLTTKKIDIIFFDRKYILSYGINLKHINKEKYHIINYCRPSKIVNNNTSSIIKKIYDSNLTTDEKKLIVNVNTGRIEKLSNKTEKTKLFLSLEEAKHYRKKFGGHIFTVKDKKLVEAEANQKLYYLIKKKKEPLQDGFYPIKLLIYDTMRLKLLQMCYDLLKNNIKIYGINTDAIFVSNTYKPISNIDKNSFEGIGKVKYLYNVSFDKHNKKLYTNTNIDIKPFCQHRQIDFQSEERYKEKCYEEEIIEKLNHHNNIIVMAEFAGSGKTELCKSYINSIGINNALIIAPFNKLCQELRQNGYKAITLYKLLGTHMTDDGDEKETNNEYNVSNIKCIIFDEIFNYTTNNLYRIKQFMKKYPDMKFVATGDCNQNSPIEQLNNVENYKKYYYNIILKMFPNYIKLKIIKRLNNDIDKERMKNIKKLIFDTNIPLIDICKKEFKVTTNIDETSGKYICYYNNTARQINNIIHERTRRFEDFVKVNGTKFYTGVVVVCRKYIKAKYKLYVNFEYVIKSIDSKNVVLEDCDGEYKIQTELLKHFSLSFARTCHSCQGLTISNKITICDVLSPFATREWFWTCITRCTDLNNIMIWNNKLYSIDLDASITKKITGHKQSDKKSGREFTDDEYISLNDVKMLLKKQNFKCCYCNKLLQFKKEDQFSIDRIDGRLAHLKTNFQITCLSCNCAKH